VDSYGEDTWLNCVKCSEDKEHNKIMPPTIKLENSRMGQVGSLFPKLLYLYECGDPALMIQNPQKTDENRSAMTSHLEAYYSPYIGFYSRSTDHDNLHVYPEIIDDYRDYLITHNIEVKYGSESLLKLIHKQLKNLSPKHCYMTQIKAYDKNFDTCYQSIKVINTEALQKSPSSKPVVMEDAWCGMRNIGWNTCEVVEALNGLVVEEINENDLIVTRDKMNSLIVKGLINHELISLLESRENVFWLEYFDADYSLLTSELFFEFSNFRVTSSSNVLKIPFNWDC